MSMIGNLIEKGGSPASLAEDSTPDSQLPEADKQPALTA